MDRQRFAPLPINRMAESDWFWPAVLTFPLGAFLIVFFW